MLLSRSFAWFYLANHWIWHHYCFLFFIVCIPRDSLNMHKSRYKQQLTVLWAVIFFSSFLILCVIPFLPWNQLNFVLLIFYCCCNLNWKKHVLLHLNVHLYEKSQISSTFRHSHCDFDWMVSTIKIDLRNNLSLGMISRAKRRTLCRILIDELNLFYFDWISGNDNSQNLKFPSVDAFIAFQTV